MGHKTLWLPMLIGSAGFFSVSPAAAQVASGQLWGMQTEQTEPDQPEPTGPQVAPAYLWGLGAAQTEGAVFSAADRDARLYQEPRSRAPAPSAPAVAINFSEADTAGLFEAFARRGVPVEDDRGSAPNETAWSRDAVRTSAAGSEFMGEREEWGSPDRQGAGLFTPVSASYAPAVADEALTVDILRRRNSQATRSFAPVSVSYAPAVADEALTVDVLRRGNRQAAGSFARKSVSYSPAVNAAVVADEASTADIFRPTFSPSSYGSELMTAPSSELPPVPSVPVEAQRAVATLGPRRVNRGRNDVNLFQPAVLLFQPEAADEALAIRIVR
jgi:hypothetical protein